MPRRPREDPEYFREQYDPAKSEVDRKVLQRALGQDVGGNGYTTVAEARRLTDVLALSDRSLLLDLGAGRGWPGTFLAWSSGCRCVAADVPGEALLQARAYAAARGVTDRVRSVRADGTALPFSRGAFDAIVHADVFC